MVCVHFWFNPYICLVIVQKNEIFKFLLITPFHLVTKTDSINIIQHKNQLKTQNRGMKSLIMIPFRNLVKKRS